MTKLMMSAAPRGAPSNVTMAALLLAHDPKKSAKNAHTAGGTKHRATSASISSLNTYRTADLVKVS